MRPLLGASLSTGGPAVVGGAMLLINKIAMGLFVGFGPLFVLILVFDYTNPYSKSGSNTASGRFTLWTVKRTLESLAM